MFGLEIAGDEPAAMDAVNPGRGGVLFGLVNPDGDCRIAVAARDLTVLDL